MDQLQSLKDAVFADVERELAITRKVLERLPEDRFDWKPHEKSMSLGRLAWHVADLPEWARASLAADELDAALAPRPPKELGGSKELLERFDRHGDGLRKAIADFDAAKLNNNWTMRNGAQVIVLRDRLTVFRVWSVNHMVHHRGQLCLYLRLLNVPVPAVYFNSADEPAWVFE